MTGLGLKSRPRHHLIAGALVALLLVAGVVVASSRGSSEMVPAEWRLAEAVAPTSDVLQIEVALADSCDEVRTVTVGETRTAGARGDDVVRIEAFVHDGPWSFLRRCEPGVHLETVTLELSEPLGDRRLVGCVPSANVEAIRFGAHGTDCLGVRG